MADDRIELFVGLIETIDVPGAAEACRRLLSVDERARADRFVFERHRRQYIFAHAMLRLALSQVASNVAPTDWSFGAGRYGRPFVAAPATSTALHFSLSHADGCVACVVSRHEAVGVDVETVSRRVAPLSTALRFFAPEEVEALRGLPEPAAIERFFDYWTLKEAYLKARGFGLNLPLDAFAMQVSREAIEISFKPDIVDDPNAWRFSLCSPSPAHRLAIADGSRADGGLPISRHAWPLREAAE
ncbi:MULTISPECIES: 4'-phosphopantetheinyl transferase superfamily protein [unclassified Bradyrhizobium]|uniref:4'-phosphopantetheinyl transferase family protein n=1 Tax=unclassified Bradyrhizobium TaxID=2631580 RepID=UPI001CD2FAAB|nr:MULTISPECIES: 4'-phosphopantetheinyl transferase superfamily protein [unclassified Bradyrhizobium]MCA1376369.1 4'-phosphopantetheinyl transferase superfamily protein [Bradyrhizobium sp. IC4060]MCA1487136.1 4'-phosphopantetheinyl transferase superfamily protein [Bradyrhizobium sp. IC4061]MCA1542929.1 4'-phosphopantetheinyl transferase superfamily protein [Bradyrhizobium sp. NBAIM32]MCA1550977.1 4'-phosphopantetheinyl transferase superfamily protein [Bradyrhizobium sp. BRP19]